MIIVGEQSLDRLLDKVAQWNSRAGCCRYVSENNLTTDLITVAMCFQK